MLVRVRFRFNKQTGRVEQFLVEQESQLQQAEHNLEHDRIAVELGSVLERDPGVSRLAPEQQPQQPQDGEQQDEAVPQRKKERLK